jgi:probable F420-dependent oxidoreductase
MKIGFGVPVSGAWATPDNLLYFTTRAEELGYDSLWTFQRLIVPAGYQGDPVYSSVLDPLVALGFVASRTTRIRLGVALINAPYLSPAYLAKQAATVDVLSAGRLDLGIGLGWSAPEFQATGVEMEHRGARLREYVAAMRTLWTDDPARFEGRFYRVPPSLQLPRPVQRPHIPILIGGSATAALRRAGRLADGWISRSATDLSRISAPIAQVRAGAEAAGKDPSAVRIVVRGVVRPDAPPDRPLAGSYAKIREDVAWLESQGVTEVFYDLNFDPQVGNPDVPEAAARERAETIMNELSPAY